jgi:hypothetical protein
VVHNRPSGGSQRGQQGLRGIESRFTSTLLDVEREAASDQDILQLRGRQIAGNVGSLRLLIVFCFEKKQNNDQRQHL